MSKIARLIAAEELCFSFCVDIRFLTKMPEFIGARCPQILFDISGPRRCNLSYDSLAAESWDSDWSGESMADEAAHVPYRRELDTGR